jgi:hypothetical protein
MDVSMEPATNPKAAHTRATVNSVARLPILHLVNLSGYILASIAYGVIVG